MKRRGIHKPTLEDVIEVSGVEMLHPGGLELTRRSAEIAGMRPGMKVLDVSSGRGTLAILYTEEYGVEVTGLDLSEEMIKVSPSNALGKGLDGRVTFIQGDLRLRLWHRRPEIRIYSWHPVAYASKSNSHSGVSL